MISFILPTRNRPERLDATLAAIGRLDAATIGDAEVIIVDNASRPPAEPPAVLGNGAGVRVVRELFNAGAAARNRAARLARGDWLVMLDDDSYPLDSAFVEVLAHAPCEVLAVGADIELPDGRREAGGLPEVIVGCGAAIRRAAFLEVGGYDPSFGYYGEEYDLCAKLIARGGRIRHDRRFRVRHEKITRGRSFDLIARRLVRNNAWIAARYVPPARRAAAMERVFTRYAGIAVRERASSGFVGAMTELLGESRPQASAPLSEAQYDRFTGLAHVRRSLDEAGVSLAGARVALVRRGKNAWAVEQAVAERGANVVASTDDADYLAIGTLSPGPMWDAEVAWRGDGRLLPGWIL